MTNQIQEIIEYCNQTNQETEQYQDSIQSINFLGSESDKESLKALLKDLNIVVIDGD